MQTPFVEPIYITRPLLPDLALLEPKLREIWARQWLTNHGKYHDQLESELSQVLGANNVSVTNNGTVALLIALRALDLREGEVITTPFTFPATPHAISWNGLSPVFCDIRPDTFCIDESKIEGLITEKTKAILGVHVFGFPCHVDEIQRLAEKYSLKVIYDAAHAFETEINKRPVAVYGDISCFSFHATKLYHSVEGGCLAFNDDTLKEKIYLLRNFGIENEESVVDIGINGKMNEVQAAIGLLVLDMVEEERQKRAKIYQVYKNMLENLEGLILPVMPENIVDSNQYFPVRIKYDSPFGSRDKLFEHLNRYNVIARKYFYPLCSEYPHYRDLPSSRIENLPVSNMIIDEVLCLPFYGDMDIQAAEKICSIIIEAGK